VTTRPRCTSSQPGSGGASLRVKPRPPAAIAAGFAHAVKAERGPIVLMDVGDNIGGGSAGDGTVRFAELLKQHATGPFLLAVSDGLRIDEAAIGQQQTDGDPFDQRWWDQLPNAAGVARTRAGASSRRSSGCDRACQRWSGDGPTSSSPRTRITCGSWWS